MKKSPFRLYRESLVRLRHRCRSLPVSQQKTIVLGTLALFSLWVVGRIVYTILLFI